MSDRSIAREWWAIFMAGPAAFTVVAALSKKLPIVSWIERIVLQFSAYSAAFWHWVAGFAPLLGRVDHHMLTLLAILSGVLARELMRSEARRRLFAPDTLTAEDRDPHEGAWFLLNAAAILAGFIVFGWFSRGILGIIGAVIAIQIGGLFLHLLRREMPPALFDWTLEKVEDNTLSFLLNPLGLAVSIGLAVFFSMSDMISIASLDVVLILTTTGLASVILIPIIVTESRAPAYILLVTLSILFFDWVGLVVVPWVEAILNSVPT